MSENKASSVWSPEEDRELARLQEKFGNRWALVAAELKGKTGQQCAQRWRHKVNPNIRKEKWSEEEDAKLADLYARYGQRWAEIARHLEGRTDQQCMGRWRRHLDPSVKKDAWATAEDAHLHKLHDTLGPKWSLISKELKGRTAQQCRARWFQLQSPSTTSSGENSSVALNTDPVLVFDRPGDAARSSAATSAAAPPAPFTPPMSPTTPTQSVESAPSSGLAGVAAAAKPRRPSTLGPQQALDQQQSAPKRLRLQRSDSDASSASAALRVVKGGMEKKRGGAATNVRRQQGRGKATESGGVDMLSILYNVAITFEREAKIDATISRGLVA